MDRSKDYPTKLVGAGTSSDFEVRSASAGNSGFELVPGLSEAQASSPVSEDVAMAFATDRHCAECGQPVRSPGEAALLVGAGRIAHAKSCFIPALLRGHPSLSRLAARARAQEVDIPQHSHPASPVRVDDAAPGDHDG